MYGECSTNLINPSFKYNCPYTGPAKELDAEGLEILRRNCPAFDYTTKTCCDKDQLKTFDSSIKTAANFIKRCPSCYDNFVKIMCGFPCHPEQSNFVNVTGILKDKKGNKGCCSLITFIFFNLYIYFIKLLTIFISISHFTGKDYVNSIEVYATNNLLNGTYNSCSKVSMPSSGQLVMDVMCGSNGASRCDFRKFFQFLGDASTGFVPFEIKYIPTDKPVGNFKPFDEPITPCSKGLSVSFIL